MILALRTDKPEAQLYLYENNKLIEHKHWHAHRELSDTLISQIETLLARNNKTIKDLTGIIVYQGPGSFTGLRIGITVANTLSYSLNLPIVSAEGEEWLSVAQAELLINSKPGIVVPVYGSEAHITKPRK